MTSINLENWAMRDALEAEMHRAPEPEWTNTPYRANSRDGMRDGVRSTRKPMKPRPSQRKENPQLPGEVPMKVWRQAEAARLGTFESAIHQRLYAGYYEGKVTLRRVNARVVFVRVL